MNTHTHKAYPQTVEIPVYAPVHPSVSPLRKSYSREEALPLHVARDLDALKLRLCREDRFEDAVVCGRAAEICRAHGAKLIDATTVATPPPPEAKKDV